MATRNYKLKKTGGLKPGANPEDIIRKFEKINTTIFPAEEAGSMYIAREIESCIRENSGSSAFWVLPPGNLLSAHSVHWWTFIKRRA